MCLLSYIPQPDAGLGPILTSNRDISIHRPAADSIMERDYNGKTVAYPRDYKGGSWMAYDQQQMIFLLNGYKINHQSREAYARSRGLILLDLFIAPSTIDAWATIDLTDIEPFTIVYFSEEGLYEFGWDENRKFKTALNLEQSHLWMSSTLYTETDKQRIWKAFKEMRNPTSLDLLEFNESNNYAAIKIPSEKIERVETVCTYQLLRDKKHIRHIELIHQ